MAAKDVRFGANARERMLRGRDVLADAVKSRSAEGPQRGARQELGARGSPSGRLVTVAKEIELATVREHGAQRCASGVQDQRRRRDGTTTATVCARPSCREAQSVRGITNDLNGGIDKAVAPCPYPTRKNSRKISASPIAQVLLSANAERRRARTYGGR
jgi:chaperonin GroEL